MSVAIASPHVLLLPGNMCDARLWDGVDRAIIRAMDAFDLTSTTVDFEQDDSIKSMACRALSISQGPLIPIGFSMGGIVALEMYRQAPGRILALGLIDTTAHPDSRGNERLRQQADIRAGDLERVVLEELKPNYLATMAKPVTLRWLKLRHSKLI